MTSPVPVYDVDAVRAQFPLLRRVIGETPLAYLDSAASAQKPLAVLDAMDRYYRNTHANVHRGVHRLATEATAEYENAREVARRFLGAPSTRGIVFVRGTTEAINLVAASWGASVRPGDEIVVTEIEHHSNIVPWQLLAERTGAVLRPAPVLDDGSLDREAFERLLGPRTRLVAVCHVSNAIGTVMPIRWMAERAHAAGALLLVDGAQGAVHLPLDMAELGCDFYAFSSHKVYGPTGIGVLWAKEEILDAMPPWQGGGEMIAHVSFAGTTYAGIPARFEAGTPAIAEAVGLGAALDWLATLGRDRVAAWEAALLREGTERLASIPGLRLVGTAPAKVSILSFVVDGIHPQDLATLLDEQGIAVRAGHHCAEPAMQRFGVPGTARASLACTTTSEELERLEHGIRRAIRILR